MASYNIGSSTVYNIRKQKDQLWSFMATSESAKGLFKWQTLKEPQIAELDKVLYKWFTAMHFKGKPMTGPMIIKKAECFYVEMEIIDNCAVCEGWLQNFKEPAVEGDMRMEYYSD